MTTLETDDVLLDEHTQEYRRSAADAAAAGRRAAVLCAPYSMVRDEPHVGARHRH